MCARTILVLIIFKISKRKACLSRSSIVYSFFSARVLYSMIVSLTSASWLFRFDVWIRRWTTKIDEVRPTMRPSSPIHPRENPWYPFSTYGRPGGSSWIFFLSLNPTPSMIVRRCADRYLIMICSEQLMSEKCSTMDCGVIQLTNVKNFEIYFSDDLQLFASHILLYKGVIINCKV